MERERTIRLEGYFLNVLAVEIVNYEKIAHVFDEMEAARAAVDPIVVDIRKLNAGYIRRHRVPKDGQAPFVVYCRIRKKGPHKDLLEKSVSLWYGEEMISRAIKRIVQRGFYTRLQIEETVERLGALGWRPSESMQGVADDD
ncbi:MAG: hypothetical protein CSA35_07370 [Dethiosulfovibrio peptidovorans]|nr:MAG: hypothetical protein CSA35_07370 [Dethiosulfovibrio peptidovorans]